MEEGRYQLLLALLKAAIVFLIHAQSLSQVKSRWPGVLKRLHDPTTLGSIRSLQAIRKQIILRFKIAISTTLFWFFLYLPASSIESLTETPRNNTSGSPSSTCNIFQKANHQIQLQISYIDGPWNFSRFNKDALKYEYDIVIHKRCNEIARYHVFGINKIYHEGRALDVAIVKQQSQNAPYVSCNTVLNFPPHGSC